MKESCLIKKCRIRCYEKIDETQRQVIFQKFWNLGNHDKHLDFLAKHVIRKPKKVITTKNKKKSRREFTFLYNFTFNESLIQVCKTFFLNTLDITDIWIRTVMSKIDRSEIGVGSPDNRGRTLKNNLQLQKVRKFIRQHIDSLPVMDSHYIRKDSSRKYLQVDIQSLSQMYRLYVQWAKETKVSIATYRQYRYIFEYEYNIGFFIPKKDQCDECERYLMANDIGKKAELEEKYNKHINNKEIVRKLKDEDKKLAQEDNTLNVACYDLQKILVTPLKDVSIFYYKLKYSTFNFTIFDIGNTNAFCYVWHEIIAKRGANEIGSFVLDYIENKSKDGVTQFIFYSDNCAGQNRNRFIYAMYAFAVQKFGVSIIHRFLEKGHTQNEGDSVHALIERQKKGKVIYTPDQWIMLIKMAKVIGDPYIVKEVCQNSVYDLKKLINKERNWTKDEKGNNIKWNEIRQIKIHKETPNLIHCRYDFEEENEYILNLEKPSRKKNVSIKRDLVRAYNKPLPISKKKYEHLQFLCKKGVPEIYHQFYQNLPYSEKNQVDSSEDED